MSGFPADRLTAIDQAMEVEIETRRDPGAPSHRVVIWIVVDAGEVFIRSVRGTRGRWFRELTANPEAILHVRDAAMAVRGMLAADAATVERCSLALGRKYAGDPALRSMLRTEVLPTTIRLRPA